MMRQGKDYLSSDLDIFGEDTGEDTQDTGDEFDIFGGALDADEATENPSEEATETPEEEVIETTTQTENPETNSTSETTVDENKTNSTEGDEPLDIDLENLFNEIEAEAKGNGEIEKLVDELRGEITGLQTEKNILQKENSILNEKLMSKVGDESNLGIYKGVISNLESNPKLMMLVKHLGNSDSETIKSKLVSVVSDILFDLTGEDVSDLINKDQSNKILSVSGKGSGTSLPETNPKDDDEEMDYEESISSLF